MATTRHYSADAKGFCHQYKKDSDLEAWNEAVGWARSNGWKPTTQGVLELWDLGNDVLVKAESLAYVLAPDPADRRQAAIEALEKCYGIHATSDENDRAWGLKASEEDAVLSILATLYPADWMIDTERIYRMREQPKLVSLAATYFDISSEGVELGEVVDRILPLVEKAVAP